MDYYGKCAEIIPNRLYWISDHEPPKNQPESFYFSIDKELIYQPFNEDFGPLNLGYLYRFVVELDQTLKNLQIQTFKIFHYTSLDQNKRANAAVLMGAFQILYLNRTADQAWLPFQGIRPQFVDFRDASQGPCSYGCKIIDVLRGLERAVRLRWFNVHTFNQKEYEFYEKIENGDMNWIIPNKFLAFSGPQDTSYDYQKWKTFTPEDYVPIFKKFGVTLVIRLNQQRYDADRFTRYGLKHVELYFLDGSCPSEDIIQQFFRVVEYEPGAIAIHCKAGLGRTGTLIGLYAMKHYQFPAADFIGWIRLCRPGSILGPQQHFLNDMQRVMFSQSVDVYSNFQYLSQELEHLSIRERGRNLMTPDDRKKAVLGEKDQANYLVSAKRQKSMGAQLIQNNNYTPERSNETKSAAYLPFNKKYSNNDYQQQSYSPQPTRYLHSFNNNNNHQYSTFLDNNREQLLYKSPHRFRNNFIPNYPVASYTHQPLYERTYSPLRQKYNYF